jgi:hypothetical protein
MSDLAVIFVEDLVKCSLQKLRLVKGNRESMAEE